MSEPSLNHVSSGDSKEWLGWDFWLDPSSPPELCAWFYVEFRFLKNTADNVHSAIY